MLILFSLLAQIALAAPAKGWKIFWETPVADGRPVAVLFHAQEDSLLVAVAEAGGGARVDQYSLDGTRQKTGLVRAKGAPGVLRAFDGQLYWRLDGSVAAFSLKDGKPLPAPAAAKGSDFVVTGQGAVLSAEKGGLFLLVNELYTLEGNRVRRAGEKSGERVCARECVGLWRSSAGAWLTLEGRALLESRGGRFQPLLKLAERASSIAYVYRKDAKEDLIVVALPSGKLVGYRR